MLAGSVKQTYCWRFGAAGLKVDFRERKRRVMLSFFPLDGASKTLADLGRERSLLLLSGDLIGFHFHFRNVHQRARMLLDRAMGVAGAVEIDRFLVVPGAKRNKFTRTFPAAQKVLALTARLLDQ